jgi:hypothetical protein
MGINLEKLSAAPWVAWQTQPTGSSTWDGKMAIAGLPILTVDRAPVFREVDAQFIALARNAFAVLMNRGWHPRRFEDGKWGVYGDNLLGVCADLADDPFTALVQADAWYRENVEKGDRQ